VIHADRWADMTNITHTYCNSANTPNTCSVFSTYCMWLITVVLSLWWKSQAKNMAGYLSCLMVYCYCKTHSVHELETVQYSAQTDHTHRRCFLNRWLISLFHFIIEWHTYICLATLIPTRDTWPIKCGHRYRNVTVPPPPTSKIMRAFQQYLLVHKLKWR
jgi:hypothetical protein